MKLDFEKIHKLRKNNGYSITGLCKLVGISRTTLWKWEHLDLQPTETSVIKLSEILAVSVSEISDIDEPAAVSQNNLSDIVDTWLTLTDVNDKEYRQEINGVLNVIKNLDNKLNQSVFIIKALLDSTETMFYIKDNKLKYITANSVFLKNVSYEPSTSVRGKDDYAFFSNQEAKENIEEDSYVLQTGKPILRKEALIPGCRKKKWGIISKLPAFDKDKKIVGIVGTFVDITDRKESEETRELLEKILDTVPFDINIFDEMAKKVVYGNAEADRLFKEQKKYYSKKTVLRNFNDLIKILRNKNSKFPKRSIYEFKKSDGETQWRENILSAMEYQDKKYFLRIARDYTDMKKVQVENELYREMFNVFSIEDQLITWAIMYEGINKYQVCYLSNEFETVTGYPKSDFIKKKSLLDSYVNIDFCIPEIDSEKRSMFSVIHPRYLNILDKRLRTSKEIPRSFVFKLIKADKKILTVLTSISKKKIEGINTVFFGKAKVINEH